MKRQTPFFTTLVLLTVFCAQMTGCQPPPQYDLAFSTPKDEPVYFERVVYDDAFSGVCGMLTCCWKRARKINVLAPPYPAVPKKIFVRWFNYKQQQYYEATVTLPDNGEKIMRSLRKPEYGPHILTTGVKPDGLVVIWFSNGLSEKSGTWIEVARAQGHVAEGDPELRRNSTRGFRERGMIP